MSEVRTLNHIRKIGLEKLAEALGPIGMVRFIQSYDLGSGDYTRERSRWLDESLEEVVEGIKKRRSKNKKE